MKGRPVRGGVCGLLFGLSLALFLLTTGVLPLDSVLLIVLPLVLLVAGVVLGIAAPLKRSRLGQAPSAGA
ncbi:MAG: hypothetical protein ACT4OV_12845 [Microthrixaceae bacterium]